MRTCCYCLNDFVPPKNGIYCSTRCERKANEDSETTGHSEDALAGLFIKIGGGRMKIDLDLAENEGLQEA